MKITSSTKFWHKLLPHTPKTARYTLCEKVDSLFVVTLENIVIATHTSNAEKSQALSEAITKLDLLRFFLRVGWEIQAIASKKYITLSEDLDEVGRMLGGWLKHTNKNSRQ